MSYLTLVILTLVIGVGAQWLVNSRLKKYQRVPVSNMMTGAEAARQMLAYYGIQGVHVGRGAEGQDFFDPRNNSITLSPSVFDGRSVTALATASSAVMHISTRRTTPPCAFARQSSLRLTLLPTLGFLS